MGCTAVCCLLDVSNLIWVKINGFLNEKQKQTLDPDVAFVKWAETKPLFLSAECVNR